jgi:hypothetical protein
MAQPVSTLAAIREYVMAAVRSRKKGDFIPQSHRCWAEPPDHVGAGDAYEDAEIV